MYSTYNEGKFVVVERFIKTLKNKIYKNTATISKNVYFNIYMTLSKSITIRTIVRLKWGQ